MTPSDKLREFADKWGFSQDKTDEGFLIDNDRTRQCLSDLTALISEGYVSKEKAGYPLEFIEWLIKDQEIFFGELNEEYILNDNIHVDGRKLQTIDELFNYWKENEQ
jgi:hypothetical protein